MTRNKIYFASDFHLGIPNLTESHKRERLIVNWLTEIEKDAKAIYLVGDIFDFWFEYRKVVPKGFVRLLGKLAELTDNGIMVHFLVGNHDLWANDYLEKEIGVIIHHKPIIIEEQNKRIFISHGDSLGDGDLLYKILRQVFTSKVCQFLFARIHPNFGLFLAHNWSKNSRKKHEAPFKDKEKEALYKFCKKHQKTNPLDYYVFGHRHIPLELNIDHQTRYINLGEWLSSNSYGELDKGNFTLKYYK